jgi:hypothetical protein
MNTDRELLQAAARAAGIDGVYCEFMNAIKRQPGKETPYGEAFSYWNALEDNGDALRLAVKLRLNITFTHELGRGHKNEFMQVSPKTMGHLAEFGPLGSDPSETIRRAIVRAAASLEQGAEK